MYSNVLLQLYPQSCHTVLSVMRFCLWQIFLDMPVLFDEIPLENIGKIKMITAQGNPPFEIGAFAHVASNPILVFSIEFAAIIQMFPQLIHSAAL